MAAGLRGWLESIGFGRAGGSSRVGMDPQEAVVDPTAQGGPTIRKKLWWIRGEAIAIRAVGEAGTSDHVRKTLKTLGGLQMRRHTATATATATTTTTKKIQTTTAFAKTQQQQQRQKQLQQQSQQQQPQQQPNAASKRPAQSR